MREHIYYVYILASAARVLYTGVTSNLHKRTWQHKEKIFEGFTDKFRACRLVYWESFDDVRKAIDREKQIKRWRREEDCFDRAAILIGTIDDWYDLKSKA